MFEIRVDDELRRVLLEEQHAEALFALLDRNRAHLRRWLPWLDQNTELGHTRGFVRATLQQHASRNGFSCGLFWRNSLAGVVGLHFVDWTNRRTSIGYWLGEEFEGQGLVTRACAAVLDQVFDALDLHLAEIACAPDNRRSCAIPERLGFRREATLRQREWLYDHFVDHVVYSMLAEEWRARRR